MNEIERGEFKVMQKDVAAIKESVENLKNSVNKLYIAIGGNELTKDSGLVGKVIDQGIRIRELESRVNELERQTGQSNFKWKAMYTAIGAVGLALVSIAKDFLSNFLFKQ